VAVRKEVTGEEEIAVVAEIVAVEIVITVAEDAAENAVENVGLKETKVQDNKIKDVTA
jgi:hypothetical protein